MPPIRSRVVDALLRISSSPQCKTKRIRGAHIRKAVTHRVAPDRPPHRPRAAPPRAAVGSLARLVPAITGLSLSHTLSTRVLACFPVPSRLPYSNGFRRLSPSLHRLAARRSSPTGTRMLPGFTQRPPASQPTACSSYKGHCARRSRNAPRCIRIRRLEPYSVRQAEIAQITRFEMGSHPQVLRTRAQGRGAA